MSRRIFATHTELEAQLDPALAAHIWSAASPTTDSDGVVRPSVDPLFGGAYAPADGGLEAEINVTRLVGKLTAVLAELKKVK